MTMCLKRAGRPFQCSRGWGWGGVGARKWGRGLNPGRGFASPPDVALSRPSGRRPERVEASALRASLCRRCACCFQGEPWPVSSSAARARAGGEASDAAPTKGVAGSDRRLRPSFLAVSKSASAGLEARAAGRPWERQASQPTARPLPRTGLLLRLVTWFL